MESFQNSTNNLFTMIETNPTGFIENIETEKLSNYSSMFTDYFYQLLKEKNMSLSQLVYKTTISQSHLYQIASGKRHLSRDTAIILTFAMELDLEQTQTFLKNSKNAILYPKVKRDALIICCIECGLTFEQTNDILLSNSEKGLSRLNEI